MRQQLTLSQLNINCIRFLIAFLTIVIVTAITVPGTALAASEREARILSSGKLKVCIWPDYFSISYKNKKTNQLEGIDIDLSRQFAKELGVDIEYVATHFGVFIQDIQQDKCDIAMFGVGKTELRAQQIDYSQPYLSSGMYGITSTSNPSVNSWESIDQPGVIVCVQKGTYMEEAMRDTLKNAELLTVVKHSQREVEVRSGRADVFITDYPYGQKMVKSYDWAHLLTPKTKTKQFQYAYAIKKGQPEWLQRVNQFVAAIKADGRLERYAEKNNLLPIALTDQ